MTWSAQQYVAFENERTRPVRDLLSAVPRADARSAMELDGGPGNSTEVVLLLLPRLFLVAVS
jgi:trans-aconitate 2-methyltransferase